MAAACSSCDQQIVEHQAFGENREALLERERPLPSPRLYDVFISHRGPDVKQNLASQLYRSLQKRRCRAFLDSEEIQVGETISSPIQYAIRTSLVQIAIFSKGYAQSKWCLDELLLMLQQTEALFISVFYEVEPWELRYIDKGAYAQAFSEYERKGRNLNKLHEWKRALDRASYIKGFELIKHKRDLCDKIVSAAVKRIEEKIPINVAEYPVGLAERVEDFENHCRHTVEENIMSIGIYGLGGSGKTTLAKELFNHKRSNYSASCFLYDVRDASANDKLHSLQAKLLKDLFTEEIQFDNIHEGKTYLGNRLRRSSNSGFFIVLDDIDHQEQLDALSFRDMQSPGNLIIVTTRDERVLTSAGISIHYNMKGMDLYHAKELFCWHAFHKRDPVSGFEDLVQSFIKFCGGLPLSLKVLGAHVSGSNERNYWLLELGKVQKTLPDDIKQRLKISFDGLEDDEKQIFIDIACFFIGKRKDTAMRIWKGSGWNAEHALQVLTDKCLVEEKLELNRSPTPMWEEKLVFRMHDHVQDLGRQMAAQFSPPRLWQPQHLKSMESKGFRKILGETKGRCFHGLRDSFIGSRITFFIGNSNDSAETLPVLMWLELDCNLERIPLWIPLQNLQGLRLWRNDLQDSSSSRVTQPNSEIGGSIRRWVQSHCSFQLRELVIKGYNSSLKIQNLIERSNHLEKLVLVGETWTTRESGLVTKGTSISKSLRKLSNLRTLHLKSVSLSGDLAFINTRDSYRFKSSTNSCMNSLQTIHFEDVGLSKVLISGKICPNLQSLYLSEIPSLIEVNLKLVTTLKNLFVHGCGKLKTISGLSDLRELVKLEIEKCFKIKELPSFAHLTSLESISINRRSPNQLKRIAGIEELEGLKHLQLSAVNGGAGVWNCIYMLKRLPSEFTCVTGRAVDGAESTLNAKFLFSGADLVTPLDAPYSGLQRWQQMPGLSSAIIFCALINIEEVEGVVTMVITEKKKMEKYGSAVDMLRTIVGVYSRTVYMVNVTEDESGRLLKIFKRIIGQLYMGTDEQEELEQPPCRERAGFQLLPCPSFNTIDVLLEKYTVPPHPLLPRSYFPHPLLPRDPSQ